MTTLDGLVRVAAAAKADDESLVDAPNRADFFGGSPRRLTWAQVDSSVDAVASALASAGVGAGDAVAIQLPNVVELPLAILGCIRIGAVATPFPVQHREHELRVGLEASGARHLITAARPDRPDLLRASADVLDEYGAIMLTVGDEHPDPAKAIDVAAEPGDVPAYDNASVDAVATICWTSGTTGVPKGVPRSHAMWLATSNTQVDALDLGGADVMLCPFPLVNMAGIGGMLVPWLETTCRLVLHNPIDLPVFLGQIGDEHVTYTVAPPPLLNMLLRNDALLESVDWSSVRKITSGSAPLDPWMVEGWQDRGIEIVNAFGSNEGAALLSTQATVPDPTDRARFFPAPTNPAIEVRLVDVDSGHEITEPGRTGELRFRGPTVFDGYLGSTGDEFDADGFYRTGDIFEFAQTEPVLYRFVDRVKDIIIRGGMNVSAAEVEALISSHESVAECSVVGYPDPDLGERVGVFVVAAPDSSPTLDDVVAHLRQQQVASYKLPERFDIVEALPRNPVGKIVKSDLRDRWIPSPSQEQP